MSRRPALSSTAKAIASLLFVVIIAASCGSDGFPESYTDQIDPETGLSNVEANWLEGCKVGLNDSDLAEDANNICQCSYAEISGVNGIAFKDFVKLNDDLKGDPGSVIGSADAPAAEQRMLDIVKGCIAGGQG